MSRSVANIPKSILHENIYTVPNFLTMTRLVCAPAIGYYVLKSQIPVASSLFIYSCVTDFVDGYLARKYNSKTIVGSIIDPMADKLLMIITTASLASVGQFPLYLAGLILGKDVLMGLLAVYIRYRTLPAPKTMRRYWDFSIPSVKVVPTTVSKWNTGFQMLYISMAILQPIIGAVVPVEVFGSVLEYYGYFVGGTTVVAGASYLVSKDAVRRV